jgi:hypothetical protein
LGFITRLHLVLVRWALHIDRVEGRIDRPDGLPVADLNPDAHIFQRQRENFSVFNG